MKTTIDIPEKLLTETIKHTGAKTKRDAVVTFLHVSEFPNRRHRLEEIGGTNSGFTCPNFYDADGICGVDAARTNIENGRSRDRL